jgi:hypothetical protein
MNAEWSKFRMDATFGFQFRRRPHGLEEGRKRNRMNEFQTKRASHNGRNVVDMSSMTGADSYKINGTSKAKMPHQENVAALIRLSEINPTTKDANDSRPATFLPSMPVGRPSVTRHSVQTVTHFGNNIHRLGKFGKNKAMHR